MSITIQSTIEQGLRAFENRADLAIRAYLDTSAIKLMNYAKNNARWTDRTGRARQSLESFVQPKAKGYKLVLAHGVDYGLWLELAHEKRFAILDETINHVGSQEIVPGFEKLLERLST